jgi:hypothetical protein
VRPIRQPNREEGQQEAPHIVGEEPAAANLGGQAERGEEFKVLCGVLKNSVTIVYVFILPCNSEILFY